MPDMSGHDASQQDSFHTMTARELEAVVAATGIVMSYRQLLRHCAAGTFDAKKMPSTNNIEEWFVAPASVDKGIADIRALQEKRARRDETRRTLSDSAKTKPGEFDVTGHDATYHVASNSDDIATRPPEHAQSSAGHVAPNSDTARHDVPRHVVSTPPVNETQDRRLSTEDIFEHPYVKRLELRVENLETKYEQQVRRTEDIQLQHQKELIELQRMTAVGQSQTLADFMLKAKEWVLGSARTTPEGGPAPGQ